MAMMTIKEVAERLNVHPNTIRRLIKSGELASMRVGSRGIRVDERDLEAYINRRKSET
jgi:excisionase family DNA binding protein